MTFVPTSPETMLLETIIGFQFLQKQSPRHFAYLSIIEIKFNTATNSTIDFVHPHSPYCRRLHAG